MKRNILLVFIFLMTSELFAQEALTIEKCRALALEHNKTLQASRENIKMAEELKKAVFTQFLPSFQATGSYLWNQKNLSLLAEDGLLPIGTKLSDGSFGFRQDQVNNKWVQVSAGVYAPLDANGQPFDPKVNPEKILWKDYALFPKEAMEFDIQNIFAGGIGFTQPIFLGGKIRELYNIAKSSENLAKIQDRDEINSLMLEVDEAYWRVVSLVNKKKLAEDYCKLLEKLCNNVNTMVGEGVATKGDLLKVKVKLNEAQMSLTKADNGLVLSKMALFQLCGLDMKGDFQLADNDLTQKQVETSLPDMEAVLGSKPEMQKLGEIYNIAKSNVKISQSRFMPNILLSGNYLFFNPNLYNGVSKEFDGMFSVGIAMTVPIFHFGDRIHTLRAAKSQLKIAQYKIDEAKEKIELQVTQTNFRVTEANRKLAMCERNIEKADENLKCANDAFGEGVITSTELMEAQTAWLSANSERIDASIDVRLCELYLKKAKGLSLNE